MKQRNIIITAADMTSLRALVENSPGFRKHDQAYLERLGEELELATIVEANKISANVVTMNSRVRVADLDTGSEHAFQIVFPRDADLAKNRISVLAPIGTALLGYAAGAHVEWETPGGRRRFRILEILYQPEANALPKMVERNEDKNLRAAG